MIDMSLTLPVPQEPITHAVYRCASHIYAIQLNLESIVKCDLDLKERGNVPYCIVASLQGFL